MRYFPQLWLLNSLYDIESWDKIHQTDRVFLFRSVLPYSGSFSWISIAKRLQNPLSYGCMGISRKIQGGTTMKFKDSVPLALALYHRIHRRCRSRPSARRTAFRSPCVQVTHRQSAVLLRASPYRAPPRTAATPRRWSLW